MEKPLRCCGGLGGEENMEEHKRGKKQVEKLGPQEEENETG